MEELQYRLLAAASAREDDFAARMKKMAADLLAEQAKSSSLSIASVGSSRNSGISGSNSMRVWTVDETGADRKGQSNNSVVVISLIWYARHDLPSCVVQ